MGDPGLQFPGIGDFPFCSVPTILQERRDKKFVRLSGGGMEVAREGFAG